MDLYDELHQLGALGEICAALARFVESLSPGGRFELEGRRWVYRKSNFATFTVQKRNPAVVLSVSGHRAHFKDAAKLAGFEKEWGEMNEGRGTSYSEYRIASPNQLPSAAYFIKLAFQYKNRRIKKSTIAQG